VNTIMKLVFHKGLGDFSVTKLLLASQGHPVKLVILAHVIESAIQV
jgi:hypothetical protein